MTRPLRTTFVVADAARARFVARDLATGDLHTVRELHAHDKAAHAYRGAVVESAGGHRHGLRERHEPARRAAEAFAAEIAAAMMETQGRLVLVAPARLLGAVRGKLTPPVAGRIAAELAKDLTKVSDHDLAAWLTSLEI